MLRQLLGDDTFFRGLRRFYETNRFRKAGTEDVRLAFEAEAGRPLDQFFSQWIDSPGLPVLTVNTRTEAGGQSGTLLITVTQPSSVFDVPVPVTLTYADGTSSDVVVPAAGRETEFRLPLSRTLRRAEVNRDELAALVQGE